MATNLFTAQSATIALLAANENPLSWEEKFAEFQQVEREFKAWEQTYEALPEHEKDEQFETQWSPRWNYVDDLRDDLLDTAAPDIAALLWKVEVLIGEQDGQDYCDSRPMAPLLLMLADARRLLGREALQ